MKKLLFAILLLTTIDLLGQDKISLKVEGDNYIISLFNVGLMDTYEFTHSLSFTQANVLKFVEAIEKYESGIGATASTDIPFIRKSKYSMCLESKPFVLYIGKLHFDFLSPNSMTLTDGKCNFASIEIKTKHQISFFKELLKRERNNNELILKSATMSMLQTQKEDEERLKNVTYASAADMYNNNQFTLSLAAYDKLIKTDAGINGYWGKAASFWKLKKIDSAMAVIDRGNKRFKETDHLYNLKAEIFYTQKKYKEAAEEYNNSFKINPLYLTGSNRLHCLLMTSDYKAAQELCPILAQMFKVHNNAKDKLIHQWALAYYHDNNLGKAIEILSAANLSGTKNELLLNDYGFMLFESKKLDESLKVFELLLQLNSKHFAANLVKAKIINEQGLKREACMQLKQIYRLGIDLSEDMKKELAETMKKTCGG